METNLLVKYSKIECVAFDTEVHTVDKIHHLHVVANDNNYNVSPYGILKI
jgi:hypothetical protein